METSKSQSIWSHGCFNAQYLGLSWLSRWSSKGFSGNIVKLLERRTVFITGHCSCCRVHAMKPVYWGHLTMMLQLQLTAMTKDDMAWRWYWLDRVLCTICKMGFPLIWKFRELRTSGKRRGILLVVGKTTYRPSCVTVVDKREKDRITGNAFMYNMYKSIQWWI